MHEAQIGSGGGGGQRPEVFTAAADVAEMVWRAAHDRTGKLRFPVGPDAVALAGMRRG